MLNVRLIRKIQESIANPENPFDMNRWETCICGHLHSVVTGQPIRDTGYINFWSAAEGSAYLGIPFDSAFYLFGLNTLNRKQAIAALEDLVRIAEIGQHIHQQLHQQEPVGWERIEPKLQPEPERELVCV